ncbi:MAG: hypothetical protein ACI9SJ_000062 [Flavobacteriaceae bacterium]|jgi:hypothetical protein|uniref:DUF1572 family protein n=1 Tax=Candidatus Marifrigoribacter sp. Uisw_064 TaxID=3230970 RepID=UPI003AE4F8CF
MNDYLPNVIKQFNYYKSLGEKTFLQVSEEKLFWKPNEESNNMAIIVKHMSGNMLSRWTDFLTSDGEKDWRNREAEFNNDISTKEELLLVWEKGWSCLFDTLTTLTHDDLSKEIYTRNMGHSVTEAINRQLSHYAYHIGQIVFLGKLITDSNWEILSIPKGESNNYNKNKFNKPKRKEHFTDDL